MTSTLDQETAEKHALALGYGWGRQDSAGRPGEAIAGDAQNFAEAYASRWRTYRTCGGNTARSNSSAAGYMPSIQEAYATWRETGAVVRPAAGHERYGVQRDAAGVITRGPSLPCGCPLDAGCDGYHAI
jgi:hypothetical protein